MKRCDLSLAPFADPTLDPAALAAALQHRQGRTARQLARFMGYYRNPARDLIDLLPFSRHATMAFRPYRLYQEIGLPTRLTGFRVAGDGEPVLAGPLEALRKEIVIENDIAWRINTLVDFATGQLPAFTSSAPQPELRSTINTVLSAVLEANGGAAFLQELALLGAVHGSAFIFIRPPDDLLARATAPAPTGAPREGAASALLASELAAAIRLQTLPAARVLPILPADAPAGAPELSYCAVLASSTEGSAGVMERTFAARESAFRRVSRWLGGLAAAPAPRDAGLTFDLWGPGHWQRYADGALVDEGANPLCCVPLLPSLRRKGGSTSRC